MSVAGIHHRFRSSRDKVVEMNIWIDETGVGKDNDVDDED